MVGMKPLLKIPLYHHDRISTNVSVGTNKTGQASGEISNNSSLCGVENSIEIQVNHNHVRAFMVSFLFGSWLPMMFIFFFLYNSTFVEIESQRVEVSLLKREMKFLNKELDFLRSQVVSILASKRDVGHHSELSNELAEPVYASSSRESSLPFSEQFPSFLRKKRGADEDASKNIKETSPPRRRGTEGNSQRRGKQSRKKYRLALAQRRCRRRLSFNHTRCSVCQAVHFKGTHPEAMVESGHVGPWFMDSKAVKDRKISSSFQLREDGNSVEIKEPGLYFIYAQVYYLTSHALNSFTIVLVPNDSESEVTLAYCSSSAVSGSSTSELSCFTATLHTLQAGDRIYVEQREKHRHLIMRSGHSFLGFVKLG